MAVIPEPLHFAFFQRQTTDRNLFRLRGSLLDAFIFHVPHEQERMSVSAQEWKMAADAPRRPLHDSIIFLGFAPRLTRLTFKTFDITPVEASHCLQLLQHLIHLKHLTTEGPLAAADAFGSMLMARL